MNYLRMSYKQLKALPRDELRRALVARTDARRNSPRDRIAHGIMLAILALGCVSAVTSFFVKGINVDPRSAAAILLIAPAFTMALLGNKVGRWAEIGAYVGAALILCRYLSWLIH